MLNLINPEVKHLNPLLWTKSSNVFFFFFHYYFDMAENKGL